MLRSYVTTQTFGLAAYAHSLFRVRNGKMAQKNILFDEKYNGAVIMRRTPHAMSLHSFHCFLLLRLCAMLFACFSLGSGYSQLGAVSNVFTGYGELSTFTCTNRRAKGEREYDTGCIVSATGSNALSIKSSISCVSSLVLINSPIVTLAFSTWSAPLFVYDEMST